MIDLHVHSTYSDGSFTPKELAQKARAAGLAAIALTDHDTVKGVPAFLAACRQEGVRGIAGVEISADFNPGTMHMLGYLIDPASEQLEKALIALRTGRQERNQEILRKLKALGFKLDWNEVAAFAGEDVVGRAHFAQALVAKGYVATKDQAFDRYLAKGKAAYADRYRLTPEDSIRLIREAGGAAVLAHPFSLKLSRAALSRHLTELKRHGLAGVEAVYSEYTPEQQKRYGKLARDHGLVVTGGTDFHGAVNPQIKLGVGFGALVVPDELLGPLDALAGKPLD
jgi:predicted metal-dependent phosphoesterase TrpH